MRTTLDRIKDKVSQTIIRHLQKDKFQTDFLPTIPSQFRSLVEYSFTKRLTPDETRFGQTVESFRNEIKQIGNAQKFSSFSSPHSGTKLKDETGNIIPGAYKASDASEHAKTGTGIFGGIQLRKIIEAVGGGKILELGTNTGLSGCYFLSSKSTSELVTVEGSSDLSKVADKNLSRVATNYRVLNTLFDKAIKDLKNSGEKFDIAFIDGQHESQATLYYAELLLSVLKPKGTLIFDDIYWSQDMNQAWKQLCLWPQFTTTLDLGNRGVCIVDPDSPSKRHFDVCDYSGRPSIFRKNW